MTRVVPLLLTTVTPPSDTAVKLPPLEAVKVKDTVPEPAASGLLSTRGMGPLRGLIRRCGRFRLRPVAAAPGLAIGPPKSV